MKFYDKIKNSLNSFILLFKKNRNIRILTSLIIIFVIGISITIFSSLARVGFNMNVVYNQDIPDEAWFTKLVDKKEEESVEYKVWDGKIASNFSGGNGTKESPYLISTASELFYIEELLNSRELLRKEDNSVCTNNYLSFTYTDERLYRKENQIVYEAEDATHSSGIVINDSYASSNGKFAGYIGYNEYSGNTESVTFNVEVEESASYLLDFYYITAEDRSFEVTINDGEILNVNCLANTNEDWYNTIDNTNIQVELEAGLNKIVVTNSDYFAPNLDRIGLTKIETSVENLDSSYHYYGEYKITLTNESDTDLKSVLLKYKKNGITVTKIETANNSYSTSESITINETIEAGKSIDITLSYYTDDSQKVISDVDFFGYDENDSIYMVKDMCYYRDYESEDKYFKIINNIDFSNQKIITIGDIEHPFEGNIDGGYYNLKNLNVEDSLDEDTHYLGLFGVVNKAVIKNFIFENSKLTINGTGINYAGLLVGYANGSSKIYNNGIYSGNVDIKRNNNIESYVGSLVGYITGTTVVANSYSYANITSLGKNNSNLIIGGIVGYRNAESNVIDKTNPFVYLLTYYGSFKLNSASSYQYVYNGTIINASSTPTYCYYLWLGDTVDTNDGVSNTYAILKSYDDMIASGFEAHLNNYRYMVNYYVGNVDTITSTDASGFSDIATWYISNSKSLYPIIKKYSNDLDLSHISESSKSNSVKVNLVNSSTNVTKSYYIDITDKNEDLNDYTNRKIVLPFNSVTTKYKYGSTGKLNNYDMTLTGWELTSVIQNGKTYSKKIDGSLFNYDYTLRSGDYSASKDIGTVYAQGGFYLVPEGVTEITLKTRWAYTIYAKDQYNDMVYEVTYANGDSSIYGQTGATTNNSGLTKDSPVSTLNAAYSKIGEINSSDRQSFYDVVIMLVGNLHFSPTAITGAGANITSSNWAYTSNDRPVTIMSLDNDLDLKPDYALYTRNIHDQNWPSLRFDFVSVLQIPQVGTINAKLNAMTLNYDASFEVTETVSTDRIDLRHYQASYVKINAGYYDIYSLWLAEAQTLRKKYIYFGGYAKAIYLNSGIESRQLPSLQANDLPVFVITGGRIETLSATYFGTVVSASNDVYFYLDGGYIDKFYTTYNSSLNKSANVTINNSYVNTYYAGGHTESAFVYGGVTTNVVDSRIGSLYGGPEYGTIENGSVLNIRNSEIDKLFGSGYGGTQTTEINLVYQDSGDALCASPDYYYNITNDCSITNTTDKNQANRSYCFGRTDASYGIETAFYATTYTKSGCASKAFATYYSSLSAANVDQVFINIEDSVINEDFYGGGNKGIVDKSVVINMDNTIIHGDMYGGGLSNETETLEVYENTDGYIEPEFVSYTVDIEATYPQKYTYTWSGDKSKFSNGSSINTVDKLIYSENEGKLGNVFGEIYLNIKNSTIEGNLYGGGNLSEVNGDIHINLLGNNKINNEVYGGGNKAKVIGNTDLRINDLEIDSIYAGGKIGNVDGSTSVTVMGGSIINSIYGGGNEANATISNVYIENGEVTNVFGGSHKLGEVEESNVYTGVFNPEEQKDGSHLLLPEEIPPKVEEDTCQDRDIRYSVNIDSSNGLNLKVTNETDYTFNEYTIKIKVNNATGISDSWSGSTTTFEDGYVIITHVNQWWGTNTIAANSTVTISDNNTYLETNGTATIESVEITAIGSDGKTYSSLTCHDEVEPDTPSEPETPEEDEEKTINAKVETIYGGNNLGGKTQKSNVFVENSSVINIFGGGNLAETGSTNVKVLDDAIISESIYGGGNYGIVSESTNVIIKNAHILKNAYAGGNGTGAIVLGNTYINVSGKTLIDESLFGGGNAAETGTSATNNSVSTVILSGGDIKKSVYGGANTSKIWGVVNLTIGETDDDVDYQNINIGGTVFGGGEANASGSLNYDYSYISVTKGINMVIDQKDNYEISISGSIFGSGNASSTSGYSNINITDFGTRKVPKKIISIQRAGQVLLDNSSLDISGTTDRTNEYSSIIYALSRIDEFILSNNSTLYLQSGTNVVKELSSYQDYSNKTLATYDKDSHGLNNNVDNRLYMFVNKAFNIIDSENLQNGTFGKVNGMMFFGLYEHDREFLPDTGIYSIDYKHGDIATNDNIFKFMNGSYVMGLHQEEHDISKNGFYTNTIDGEMISSTIIDPTPDDAVYYKWIVGEASTTFTLSLTASKFATMGTDELSLLGFEKANTYFDIVSYNDNNLKSGVSLIDPDEVPRVATTNADALNTFGLKMTSGNNGWMTDGETFYVSSSNESNINGTLTYNTSNANDIPSLHFYFIHSKNITEDVKLGTVVIGMLGYTPIDEVTYKVTRIFIEVTLDTKYFETDSYESSMTPGKEYELFVNNKTDITSSSSLSAYYSLFVKSDKTIYKDGFHRVLTSTIKLPINTRITMIDRTVATKPVYYYYVVTEKDYQNVTSQISNNASGEEQLFYIYPLSKFIGMGSLSENNNYNDAASNKLYYNESLGVAEEEFIFIVDYSEANIESDELNAELLLELKDEDEYTNYDSLGVSHANMVYNLYASVDSYIDIDLTQDRNTAYAGYDFNIKAVMNFVEPTSGLLTIKDTNYTQDKMGLKISMYDSNNNKVNGASLLGTIFYIDGNPYSARLDGSVRVKISDLVTNVQKNIRIDLSKSMLATDTYKIVFESFGSSDGLYYGLTSAGKNEITIDIVNENYGLKVETEEEFIVIDSKTGNNINGNKEISYNIDYISQFSNPSIRVKLMRRKYDDIYSMDYELVDLNDYVTNKLTEIKDKEYSVSGKERLSSIFNISMGNELKTGTYKMVFMLYNEDTYIDEVYSYMIIK